MGLLRYKLQQVVGITTIIDRLEVDTIVFEVGSSINALLALEMDTATVLSIVIQQ